MLDLALANLKTYGRRFIAVTLAVLIGTAFLVATLLVGSSAKASLGQSIGEAYRTADLVLTYDRTEDEGAAEDAVEEEAGAPLGFTAEQLDEVATLETVEAVHPVSWAYPQATTTEGSYQTIAGSLSEDPALESRTLASGAFPSTDAQAVVDTGFAERSHLAIGDSIVLAGTDAEGREATRTVVVTGLTVPSANPIAGSLPQLGVRAGLVADLAGPDAAPGQALVRTAPGQLEAARDAIAAALAAGDGDASTVKTAEEQTVSDVAEFSGGQDQLTLVLLVFALVALVVTGLVVMNTFAVLVAQRTRELALLRTLGALRAQLRRSVLLEALLVGLAASALGVLAAIGVMAGLIAFARTLPEASFATLAVTPGAVIAGMAVGTLMTLVAAWLPARAATRVAPLEALRPADPATAGSRAGRVRIVFGAVLAAVGAALLALGALQVNLMVAFLGGIVSFLGVLLLSSLFLPPAVALIGKALGGRSVAGRLAALNSVRNPGRTTATASALLIGVTLVSMIMVGAQTTKASLDAELSSSRPVDLTVGSWGRDPFTAADATAAAGQAGIDAAVLLAPAGATSEGTIVFAADAARLAEVLNDPSVAIADGQILVPSWVKSAILEVEGAGGSESFATVRAGTEMVEPVITAADAERLGWDTEAGSEEATQLWLKTAGGLDAPAIQEAATGLSATLGVEEWSVSGPVLERLMFTQVIDTLLLVVGGLLAVAVLIALIGVANTLSLSVLERTRENSLLRALGLTRGQLRRMLATEAVLIAGVAALLGCVLGSVYGWLGAQSVLGAFTTSVVSLPWGQLAGVVAVAAAAGMLASVVPARRAARLSPVAGLASE
ncbi:FtsX-like permease family protein [Arthrobacter ginkgonis]|uniref:FtsX-like permease family protein n=1 Tax=Arthrobacter ginkgonis TaxID=1630594 RepID=A0ABP7BWF5_9MICC